MLEASVASRVIPIAHEGRIFFQWQIKKSLNQRLKNRKHANPASKTIQSNFKIRFSLFCPFCHWDGSHYSQFTARDSERSGLLTRLAGIGQPSAFEALLVVQYMQCCFTFLKSSLNIRFPLREGIVMTCHDNQWLSWKNYMHSMIF